MDFRLLDRFLKKREKTQPNLLYSIHIYYITCILRTVAGAVSLQSLVSDQVHAISTLKVLLTNAVYVTCRKLLKIVKLANFSGEAIFLFRRGYFFFFFFIYLALPRLAL
jgi:hypothetical protein